MKKFIHVVVASLDYILFEFHQANVIITCIILASSYILGQHHRSICSPRLFHWWSACQPISVRRSRRTFNIPVSYVLIHQIIFTSTWYQGYLIPQNTCFMCSVNLPVSTTIVKIIYTQNKVASFGRRALLLPVAGS